MKRQRMTIGRWIELIFGAAIPTLWGVVLVFVGVLYGIGALVSGGVFVGLSFLLVAGLGIGVLVTLWLLVLFGPRQMNEHPRLRWLGILTAIPGSALGLFSVLHWIGTGSGREKLITPGASFGHNLLNVLMGLSILSAIVIALRYLPVLLKGDSRLPFDKLRANG
jgi:hypothetical protein